MLPCRVSLAVLAVALPCLGACEGEPARAPAPGVAGEAGTGGTGGSAGAASGAGTTNAGAPPAVGGESSTGGALGGGAGVNGEVSGGAGVTSTGGVAGVDPAAGFGGSSPSGVGGTVSEGGAAGSAGSRFDAGGAGGDAAGAGGAGMGGSAGSSGASCPPGPFPAPMVISSKDVCQDFPLRYTWNEGPTWIESEQAFFFTNFVARSPSGGDIIKYTPDGACETFIADIGCNGLAASRDGGLLAACQQSRSVVRFDLTTKQPTTIASMYMDTMLDTPNDLVQHSNGSIYFTNPAYELGDRPAGVGAAAFRLDPNGALTMIGQGSCNGIALSPDERKLYVIQLGMWDLDEQGVPSNPASLFTSGDGMAVDCAGNVYANGSIFSASGETLGSWGNGTNLAFGGADGTTVLVAGRNTALRQLTMSVPGLP